MGMLVGMIVCVREVRHDYFSRIMNGQVIERARRMEFDGTRRSFHFREFTVLINNEAVSSLSFTLHCFLTKEPKTPDTKYPQVPLPSPPHPSTTQLPQKHKNPKCAATHFSTTHAATKPPRGGSNASRRPERGPGACAAAAARATATPRASAGPMNRIRCA